MPKFADVFATILRYLPIAIGAVSHVEATHAGADGATKKEKAVGYVIDGLTTLNAVDAATANHPAFRNVVGQLTDAIVAVGNTAGQIHAGTIPPAA